MEIFFHVDLGLISSTKVSVFELEKGPKTLRSHEVKNLLPKHGDDGDITMKDPNNINFVLNYGPYGPDRKAMLVRSDKLELDIRTTMPNDYESLYWVTPLNDDKT